MSIPLTLAVLLPIMEDVLRGLKFLHSRNILHRDLKVHTGVSREPLLSRLRLA